MKIKRIKLNVIKDNKNLLNVENTLSVHQMLEIVGGYDTTSDSSCFFNCMEYVGKEVYGNKKYQNYDYSTYGNAYHQGHNEYEGTHIPGDFLAGPQIINKDGSINQDVQNNCAELVNSYFNKSASGFVSGDDAANLFASGSNEGVIGYFKTASKTVHAVILTGYDSSTNTYTYYDPSLSSQKENQTFAASSLYSAIDCHTKK